MSRQSPSADKKSAQYGCGPVVPAGYYNRQLAENKCGIGRRSSLSKPRRAPEPKSKSCGNANWRGGILQTAEQHGAAVQIFVASEDRNCSQTGCGPNQGQLNSQKRKDGITPQKQRLINQSRCCFDSRRVVGRERSLSDFD